MMVLFRRTSSLAAFLFLACADFAAAETTGTLTGTVVDETGGVLPGVFVNLEADGSGLASVTGDAGKWRIEGVPAGPATLTFRRINFAGARREVNVAPGEVLTVDLVLVLSLTADVLVTARPTLRNIADLPEPAENLVGIASAASVGAITATQLQARPVMRPGEVLETVPGLVISQHSGEGKANQYYLRGFNLDHGTDFATTVAGMPLNMPSGTQLRHDDADVLDYFYTSRLPGEPLAGVDDVHTHPSIPRTARVGLQMSF